MNYFKNTLSILVVLIFLFTNTCQRFEPEGFLNVNTGAITAIASFSAQSGGEVTDEGGSPVSGRGVCWSRNSKPTKSSNDGVTTDGSGLGIFTSMLTELLPETTYYVRSYAINSDGLTYGDEVSFISSPLTVPSVTTDAATSVDETFSVLNGTVTEDGGAEVTGRGFYFGTSPGPVTTGTRIENGSGTGNFSSDVSSLSSGTTYYFVAYATNSAGTALGNEEYFTTPNIIIAPTVSTNDATSISESQAVLNGNVTGDGGATVTDRGFYYGTSSNPSATGIRVPKGSGTGSFSTIISDLAPLTTYYFAAYASNSAETAYGNERSFATPDVSDETVTDIDGNIYQTALIGEQVWMAENLKVTHYADGSAISPVENTSAWEALGPFDKAYCWYNNSTTNRDTYGGLYTWTAAMDGAVSSNSNPSGIQGVCPSGWHMPSDEEWKVLEIYLGMSLADADGVGYRGTDEGSKLKEIGYTHWSAPNTEANNESGFLALPGGYRYYTGVFYYQGSQARFWTTTSDGSSAWYRRLGHDHAEVDRWYYEYTESGFSVRCVKD